MRKRITNLVPAHAARDAERGWMDIREFATVEVTSEEPNFPIDSVFDPDGGEGWRASQPGQQQIRIVFDRPVSLRRIQLHFHEPALERTQEFTLRWSSAQSGTTTEIVRQQWNFNPEGSTSETEDYQLDLDDVSVLELDIKPDIGRRDAVATLSRWRLA